MQDNKADKYFNILKTAVGAGVPFMYGLRSAWNLWNRQSPLPAQRRRPISRGYYKPLYLPYKTSRYQKQRGAYRYSNYRTGGYQNKELKFKDYVAGHTLLQGAVPGTECDPTTADSISAIAQGTGPQERVGRVSFIKNVLVQGHINFDNGTTSTEGACYAIIWLVLDTQTNGAQLSAENVLVDPASVSHTIDTFQNLEYSDRFKVLKKKVVRSMPPGLTTNSGGTNFYSKHTVPFSMYHKCNIKQEHSGPTATVADMTNNSLHIIAQISRTASATSSIYYSSRVRFTD